jgi:hypothetical protein
MNLDSLKLEDLDKLTIRHGSHRRDAARGRMK